MISDLIFVNDFVSIMPKACEVILISFFFLLLFKLILSEDKLHKKEETMV